MQTSVSAEEGLSILEEENTAKTNVVPIRARCYCLPQQARIYSRKAL